jgi:hypothetical protein
MVYVPTPVHVATPSPHAQELAHKIESVIREYQQTHPRLRDSEVYQAIKLAETRTGSGGLRSRAVIAALLGLTVAMLLGTLLFWRMAA